ncbi:MAG: hypothetical protein LBS57_12640 [Treponema sp.]|jgi:hypothetical protein|nr:hypothetical protein [Treponema sp.]
MRIKCIVLCLVMILPGAALFAQTGEGLADKVSFELEFNASVVSFDSEGVVDSMTDTGFNEDGTKIGLAYEDELWGASAALKFGNENLRFLSGEIGEMFADFPLALDELYAWVKPFGGYFKFTGGIFENKDGVADYTDDIDDFAMGVFFPGEDGEAFEEPSEMTNTALVSGFLSEAAFGPVTLQFLLAPNYSKESASALGSGIFSAMAPEPVEIDSEARFFRFGGRVIADVGVGTVSALFKIFQWPAAIENAVWVIFGEDPNALPYDGTKQTYPLFGAYFDLTAVENLGLSLGYSGFLGMTDSSGIDDILVSGIDLRATWTGIEGLSLSTHNNLSFAKGTEKPNIAGLVGTDTSFLFLYNAIGATKELTEKFSVNAVISNVFSTTDYGDSGELKFENLVVGAKLITKVTENAEFNVGLNVDFSNAVLKGAFGDADDNLTVFSVPVGIIVSF